MCFEELIKSKYGVKKVYLNKPRIATRYRVATGDEYHIYDYLTVSGGKAFTKLVVLLQDLEAIFDGNFLASPWGTKLNEVACMGGIADIPLEAQNHCLDSILRNHFGCKKAFLKNRKIVGHYFGDRDWPDYEYFTVAGGKAYNKLTGLIYDLGKLLGKGFNSDSMVAWLDSIVTAPH